MASDFTARTSRPMLEAQVDVETPEQVVLSYTVAGVGSRAAAAVIDTGACVGTLVVVSVTLSLIAGRMGGIGPDLSQQWVIALFVVAQFLILWGYYVLFELLRDGQTLGKRALGLRVVMEGGRGLTIGAAATRNLVRVIDMQPGLFYVVGLVSAAVSPRGKRLGDLVAGTLVVRERTVTAPMIDTAPARGAGLAAHERAAAPMRVVLDNAEFALLDRYMVRRQALDPARRSAIAARLTAQFRARVAPNESLPAGMTDVAWLAGLHERERLARATASAPRAASGRGGQRDVPHALIVRGATRWREFATLVADVQRRGGLRVLDEDEVSDFVARYRELATDLARLQTAARGREIDAIFYLGRLVAAGHNLVYRRSDGSADAVRRFVLRDVPAEVRRSWRPIALAALLLFAPAVAAFEGVRRDPTLASQLVPASLLDRADEGVVRAKRGGGYLPESEARLRGPLLASVIMTNNVQITFLAFALGVTAGVGTAVSLVFNGVSALGAPLGLYASKGILTQILGFVLPHGVLELTAICVAGGAGFLLAGALLLPGARTRRDALVDEGARAIRLIAASTMLLVVAGLIEGNVSPRVWPLGAKGAVCAVTVVLLAGYLSLRGPRAADESLGVTAPRAT